MEIEIGFSLLFLLFIGLVFFAPELLLLFVGWGFAGMMETSKSRRLVHCGVALALLGPLLIAGCFFSAWLFMFLGLRWLAVPLGIAAFVLVPAWVIVGVAIGFAKARYDDRQEAAELKSKQLKRASEGRI